MFFGVFGQKTIAQLYYLDIEVLDKDSFFLSEKVTYTDIYADSLSLYTSLKSTLSQLHSQAYLTATIDSIFVKDSLHTAFMTVGKPYKWANLQNGNVEKAFLSQVGFRERLYQNKPFYYIELIKLQEKLLEYAENNGYPFAQIRLDSLQIIGETISAQLFMDKNALITIDAIKIEGDAKISEQYLLNYLGIKKGDLYSKQKLLNVRGRIRELPFLKESKDVRVIFKNNKATVHLFLDKKKASKFDFIIGILPDNNRSDKKLLITGTFDAEMQNSLGAGERISVAFQQLRPETQRLNLQLTYPYILNLPFGIDTDFELYKRDSTLLDVKFNMGVQYLLEGGNYLKAFWSNESSGLLTINAAQIKSQQQLPNTLDVSTSAFGLEYNLQKLDYRFNPRRGWQALLRGSAGFKTIKRNSKILELSDDNFDFGTLYDSLALKTFQYKLAGNMAYFLPLFQRSTLKAGLQTGIILSEKPIYQNEQYRIGGNRLMRGFDEESIFATLYTVLTVEYRLLIAQNSFLYAFGDLGYMEDRTVEKRIFDRPIGIGAGMTFETKVGLFGISVAVGKTNTAPFDFRAAKIHFGYVSLF